MAARARVKDLKAGSPVVKREPEVVTKYAAAATDVVYELNGKILSPDEAKVGIKGGDFIVVGESEPTYSPPPPPPEPTTTSEPEPEPTTSSVDLGAQFIESLSPEPETTTTEAPPPPPPTTKAKPSPKPSPKPKPAPEPKPQPPSDSGSSGGQGLEREFPDGELSCSEFPSAYGAVPIKWLGFNNWLGLQFTPKFTMGVSKFIDEIHTGIKGDSCSKGCMCSYACPSGYQKTQWPSAQGATKQSIGGLYCGDDNKLYRTRKDHKTLCEKGVGGVSVENKLGVEVSLCQTDYPGTEGMYIPTVAPAGGSAELTNPDQDKYYQWDGQPTSAQFYLNPKGVKKEVACTWDSPNTPANTGNWSPTIVGVGRAGDGTTFISIFQNKPTTKERLDFNIEIVGDVNSKCSYNAKDKTYYGGDDPDGCTTGVPKGGKATIRFF